MSINIEVFVVLIVCSLDNLDEYIRQSQKMSEDLIFVLNEKI